MFRRYPAFRPGRFRRPPRRMYRRNLIFDFIRVYIIFFIILGGIVFVISSLTKSEAPKENKTTPPKSISLNKVKRSDAFERGMEIINHVWDYNSERNGIKDSNEIELPGYLKEIQNLRVSGIPYAWGGYISLESSNQKDVRGFEEAVKQGYTTGNVKSEGEYKQFTAGLDCSGFISAVFKLDDKVSTRNMEDYFEPIDREDLKPMDILNCSDHHVMVYLADTPDKKGIIALESTTGTAYSKPEKSVVSFRSWEELDEGDKTKPYVAMRYRKIVEDEIEGFKDVNEINNYQSRATEIERDSELEGYIDYVEDVDYFKFTVNNKEMINIKVLELQEFCISEVLSQGGNVMLTITKEGDYSLDVPKGTYYIRFSGKDFNYDGDKGYGFLVGK